MVTLFGLLQLNKRSLFSTQYALQTINHNIANMNEPGYSRQDIIFRTAYPTITAHGVLGNGVGVATVKRATADFYTRQLRRETSNLGGWEMVSASLSEVESILGEPNGNGLSDALNAFFEAWNDLAGDPESGAMRVAVIEASNRLCQAFHSVDHALTQVVDNLNDQIASDVERVNNLLKRISDLNGQIVSIESKDVKANDMRDERDELLLELSKLINIEVKEDQYGSVDIYIGGTNVIHRTEARYLRVLDLSTQAEKKLSISLENDNSEISVESGEIAGLLEARDTYMKDVRESIDNVASIIIQKVNEIHRRGWTPRGSGFDFFEGSDAETISVSYAIQSDPDLVATSYDGTVGDNALANDIAALAETAISEDDVRTINELYNSIIASVGTYSRTAKDMVSNQELICENIETKKDSIVGVNLDEELVKLTQYQQSYEAAARVMKVVESLVQTIVDLPVGMY